MTYQQQAQPRPTTKRPLKNTTGRHKKHQETKQKSPKSKTRENNTKNRRKKKKHQEQKGTKSKETRTPQSNTDDHKNNIRPLCRNPQQREKPPHQLHYKSQKPNKIA